MTRCISRALWAAAVAAPLLAGAPALAQSSDAGFLDRIFGRDASGEAAPTRVAQVSPSELIVRLDRLEGQLRQLTGLVEQLQFRNQQLEQQVRRMQEDVEFRFQEQGKGGARPAQPRQSAAPVPAAPPPGAPAQASAPPVAAPAPISPPAAIPSRRADIFDPAENPNAPGAPRTLGSIPGRSAGIPGQVYDDDDDGIGVPGGRSAGAPLDLSTLSDRAAGEPPYVSPNMPVGQPAPGATLPPPPPRNLSATGAQTAMLPPGATAKDEYDLAYGYVLRKDYALAESGLRDFLRKYPNDRLVAEANYWLGESLYQRQRYRDAAESFLTVSTKYEKSPKAPEALLRLGQSLAALREREAACATYAEIARKFPNAPGSVKQAVERERKSTRC